MDKPAQLLEHDSGGSTITFEQFDPLESVDHCAGYVHVFDGSGQVRTCS